MRQATQQSNWIQRLSRYQIDSAKCRRMVATGVLALVLFGISAGSNPQSQKQDDSKKTEQIRRPVSLSTGEMERAMIKAGEEINKQFVKYDSVLDVQKKNVSDLNNLLNEQKKNNKRMTAILKRFNPDTVKKYEMEYIDPESVKPDTSKKKIEYPEVTPPKPKKSLWKRIFG